MMRGEKASAFCSALRVGDQTLRARFFFVLIEWRLVPKEPLIYSILGTGRELATE